MNKKITVSGTKFIDENDCEVILHGINMVCKEKEKNYIGDYTIEDFKMLKQWGFNVIRLGIFWDGVEPEPGHYDDTYLAKIDSLIQLANDQGICVYLDMHQDLFGVKYCDGAPAWATLTDGIEHVQTDLWSESYLLSPAVQVAFDRFWNNEKACDGIGIQDHFIKMWEHLARHYESYPGVIGYDFFNEPFPGTYSNDIMGQLIHTLSQILKKDETTLMGLWMDPEGKLALLEQFNDKASYQMIIKSISEISQVFDQRILNPFYQKLGSAIRKIDSYTIIFLEANYFSNAGVESMIAPVINELTGQKDSYQVYCPHGYDLLVDTDLYDQSSFDRLDVIFETHKKVQNRLEIPILVGEWGCFPDAKEPQVQQAHYLMRLFSRYKMSDTYYDFSHIKNNRVLEALTSYSIL